MQFNLGCLWLVLAILLIGGTPLLVGLLRVFAAFVLVVMLTGLALSWWIRRHAVVDYVQARSAQSRRFIELTVELMVGLAEVDGELDRREVTAIRRVFQDGLGYRGEQLLWIRDLIKASRARKRPAAEICADLARDFGVQERLIVLQVLIRVAQADGRAGRAEAAFIEDAARRLGIHAFAGAFGYGPGAGPAGARAEDPVAKALAELGLARGASAEDIKQAWRKLSLEHHPDRATHLGEEFRRLAEERMRRINAAYDVLKEAGLAA